MIPRPCHLDKPAIVIELKWDKSAVGAIEQIKEKQYGNALKDYQGNLLFAGINYNKKTKKHECVIESNAKIKTEVSCLRSKGGGYGTFW